MLASAGTLPAQTASYLDFDGLTRELRSIVNGTNLARMQSLGASHEGRDIWVVEIGNTVGAPIDTRPGLLLVANLEGDHLVGSALALETIRHLVAAEDENARKMLTEQVVYVVPRLNPDGAEAMFDAVRYARTRNGRPFDDDNDGRIDEDPPEDLNGDGVITVMRVPDPSGAYMVHPDEARLMKKADPAEREPGAYTLHWEGRDSDGDGFVNEDGPGGVDLNRNFQHAYPYWERDAGPYMVSEPESRALMDFVVAHRNIGAILTFGHSDNLVTAPDSRGELADAAVLDLPKFADASNLDIFDQGVFRTTQQGFGFGGFFFGGGGGGLPQLRGAQPGRDNDPDSGRRPATSVNRADLKYFEAVSEAYREITGIEKVAVNRDAEGAFFQFGYYQFGVPSFSTQGWALPEVPEEEVEEETEREEQSPPEAEAERPPGPPGPPRRGQGPPRGGQARGGADDAKGVDATILEAMEAADIDAFVEWAAYAHPDLGDIEIGGFRPYAVTNPPAEQLPELGRKHGEFVVRLATMLPRVMIADTEVTNHGGGVFTVRVEVENAGFFPTSLQHGVVSRSVQPTMVQIQVGPEALLTGDAKTSMVPKLDGSGSRHEVSWVIQAREGSSVEIRVRSQKAGTATATVTLR
jgi:hypothetical protein